MLASVTIFFSLQQHLAMNSCSREGSRRCQNVSELATKGCNSLNLYFIAYQLLFHRVSLLKALQLLCVVHCAVMHRRRSHRPHVQLLPQAYVFAVFRTNLPAYLNRYLRLRNL